MKGAIAAVAILAMLCVCAEAAKNKFVLTLVEKAVFGGNLYVPKGQSGFDFGDTLAAAEVPLALNSLDGPNYGSKIGSCTVVLSSTKGSPDRPEYYCTMTFNIVAGTRTGELQVAGTFRRGKGAFNFIVSGGTNDFLGSTGFITAKIIDAGEDYYTWQFDFKLVIDNEFQALLK